MKYSQYEQECVKLGNIQTRIIYDPVFLQNINTNIIM